MQVPEHVAWRDRADRIGDRYRGASRVRFVICRPCGCPTRRNYYTTEVAALADAEKCPPGEPGWFVCPKHQAVTCPQHGGA